MNKTKIEWCDYTWNPITGCLNGCEYCYARRIYQRFKKSFIPTFHKKRLSQPLKEKKPARIFVCSVSDFWGKGVKKEWRKKIYQIIEKCPQHIFQILTKQPQNIRRGEAIPTNVWVGVSVSKFEDRWRPATLYTKNIKNLKFVSIEPLLDDVVSSYFFLPDWIIVGAMTGQGSGKFRPNPKTLKHIIEICQRLKIPLFLKDNLHWRKKIQEFPGE